MATTQVFYEIKMRGTYSDDIGVGFVTDDGAVVISDSSTFPPGVSSRTGDRVPTCTQEIEESFQFTEANGRTDTSVVAGPTTNFIGGNGCLPTITVELIAWGVIVAQGSCDSLLNCLPLQVSLDADAFPCTPSRGTLPLPPSPAGPPGPSIEGFCEPACGIAAVPGSCGVADDCCVNEAEGGTCAATVCLPGAAACPVAGNQGCLCSDSSDCDVAAGLECAIQGPLRNTCQVRIV